MYLYSHYIDSCSGFCSSVPSIAVHAISCIHNVTMLTQFAPVGPPMILQMIRHSLHCIFNRNTCIWVWKSLQTGDIFIRPPQYVLCTRSIEDAHISDKLSLCDD